MKEVTHTVGYVTIERHGCLIGPTPSNIPNGVSPTSKDQQRKVLFPHETDTFSMA